MESDRSELPKLGIIAGGGALPGRLIAACREQGRLHFVLALKDQADDPAIETAPHQWLRLGKSGQAERILRGEDVQEVVFAGHVKRPSLPEMVPDLRTARVLLRAAREGLGDDGLLGLVIREFEAGGVTVVGAHTICPDLLAPAGVLSRRRVDRQADADIQRGVKILQTLGNLDVGQSCVVQQGIVLGVEAIEGTDALIQRCGGLKRKGDGGVLVKIKKPAQDDRIDMPTIGRRTIENAAAAGIRGVAIEAGATLVLDREGVIEAADRAGLFVVGIEPGNVGEMDLGAGA